MKDKKQNLNIFIYIFILLISFVVSLTYRNSLFSKSIGDTDSSIFEYFGYAMSRGLCMYKDIFDHKGPSIFIINYIAKLLGNNGLFFIEYLFLILFFIYIYKISMLFCNNIKSILVIFLTSIFLPSLAEGGNLTETYAISFIAVAIYIFSKYFIKYSLSNIDVLILGIIFSFVALLRFNLVSVWFAFIFMIIINMIYRKDFKKILEYAFYFTLGILVIVVPLIIYFYLTDSLKEFVYQSLIFNLLYLSKNNNSMLDTISNLLVKPEMILFSVVLFSSIVSNKTKLYELTIYFSVFISLISILLSNRDYSHYLVVLAPLFSLLLVLTLRNFNNISNFKLLLSGIFIPIYFVINIYMIILYYNASYDNMILKKHSTLLSSINTRDNDNKKILDVAKFIKNNSLDNEKIYVHRISGIIYLKSERLANTKYFSLPAINLSENEKIRREFLNDMKNNSPKIIVTYKDFMEQNQQGQEEEFKNFVEKNYLLNYQNDLYNIYLLNTK